MRQMMKKDVPFTWGVQHEQIFNELKHAIAARQVLSRFDCSDAVETVLTTDASKYGLGAVLTQISDGQERIIVFISRTLSDTENKYSVIEKEMLACFWATKRLRTFLWGRHFNLRTDHKPLVNVLTTKGSASERTSHRINKWSARMLEYNFNVTYVQGVNNVMADCLSRLPVAAQPDEYSHDSTNDECIARIESTRGAISVNEMQLATRYMTSKWPARKTLSAILQALYDVSDELLHRGDRIVIPETLQSRVMQLAHEGHFGMTLVK